MNMRRVLLGKGIVILHNISIAVFIVFGFLQGNINHPTPMPLVLRYFHVLQAGFWIALVMAMLLAYVRRNYTY